MIQEMDGDGVRAELENVKEENLRKGNGQPAPLRTSGLHPISGF